MAVYKQAGSAGKRATVMQRCGVFDMLVEGIGNMPARFQDVSCLLYCSGLVQEAALEPLLVLDHAQNIHGYWKTFAVGRESKDTAMIEVERELIVGQPRPGSVVGIARSLALDTLLHTDLDFP